MTDEERLSLVDIENGLPNEEEVMWALNFLLNCSDEDDLPLLALEIY